MRFDVVDLFDQHLSHPRRERLGAVFAIGPRTALVSISERMLKPGGHIQEISFMRRYLFIMAIVAVIYCVDEPDHLT